MSHRKERVAHELRARIAQILEERARDPRLTEVTITEVDVSPDLSFARVYFRSFGDVREAEQALVRAKPFVRGELGKGLRLRRVPELDFRPDDSQDRAARIDEILKDIKEGREESTQSPSETEEESD